MSNECKKHGSDAVVIYSGPECPVCKGNQIRDWEWAENHSHAQKIALALGVSQDRVESNGDGIPDIPDLLDMIAEKCAGDCKEMLELAFDSAHTEYVEELQGIAFSHTGIKVDRRAYESDCKKAARRMVEKILAASLDRKEKI